MSDASLPCAVVTGGSAGIGRAICETLLDEGQHVVSLARRPCPLEHPKLHSVECDLLDRAATGAAAQRIADRFAVTTVVHNAGVIRPALLPDVRLDDLDAVGEQLLADREADAGAAPGDDGNARAFAGACAHPPPSTSARTRSGLPLPFSIFSGGQISTAPVGGNRSRLERHCSP